MFPYSEQVEDTVQVYWRQFESKMNEFKLIKGFLWSFGIEHYAANVGDDCDAKINKFKHMKWFPLNYVTLKTMVQELETILTQKITNLNIPNGYSKYSYFSKA